MQRRPELISDTYLKMFLTQLQLEGGEGGGRGGGREKLKAGVGKGRATYSELFQLMVE